MASAQSRPGSATAQEHAHGDVFDLAAALLGKAGSDAGLVVSGRVPLVSPERHSRFLAAVQPDGGCEQYDNLAECLASRPGMSRDVALVCPATVDKPDESSLGRLCRLFPNGVVVLQHASQSAAGNCLLGASVFFSFGYRQRQRYVAEAVVYEIYEYTLADYKQTPDWLNARFWAHPERFNLDE